MSSVIWVSIFVLLVVELALVMLLCLPLPWGFRKFVIRLVAPAKGHQAIQTAMLFLLMAVMLALFTSVQDMNYAKNKEEAAKLDVSASTSFEVWEYSKLRQNRFRAERNMVRSCSPSDLEFLRQQAPKMVFMC